jgi:hypothetical protein
VTALLPGVQTRLSMHGRHKTEAAQAALQVATPAHLVRQPVFCGQQHQEAYRQRGAVQTSMVLLARESASCARPPRLAAGENTNARTLCLLRTTCA